MEGMGSGVLVGVGPLGDGCLEYARFANQSVREKFVVIRGYETLCVWRLARVSILLLVRVKNG